MTRDRAWVLRLAIIGAIVGFFSGLFGVGGGIVLVPLLISFAGFEHRKASATSLAAVLPTAIAGMIAYTTHGSVDLIAAALLAGGAILGSLLGTWLLHRIKQNVLRWIFVVFLLLVAIRMFFLVPDRSADLEYSTLVIAGLLILGFLTGTISGLLGIGGGVFIVPALMIVFGLGDLVAKGTSLLMMIPTAITGTIANLKRGHTDLKGALVIGCLSVPASIGGAALAWAVPPMLGSILFALLLVYCAVQLVWSMRGRQRSADPEPNA